MREDSVLEALIDQGLLHGVGVGDDLVQQCDPEGVFVRGRGRHDHRDYQPQRVNGQAELAVRRICAASRPVDTAGTPADACTICVSSTTRLGSAIRPIICRT
ncbi:hypothetical protein ACIO1C_20290 [Streptomyces sp. NPDC087420]|uniref:hypothetical protein n=1 Tax=Streptomyces sp. NPDC087420 TaxID=3365785 RepID=UPI003835729E